MDESELVFTSTVFRIFLFILLHLLVVCVLLFYAADRFQNCICGLESAGGWTGGVFILFFRDILSV